jgi:hypothetical protein
MKGAIATVEIFGYDVGVEVTAPEAPPFGVPRRFSLVIGAPQRAPSGTVWHCRVALADVHRPEVLEGRDSLEALMLAVERARSWLAALHAEGYRLFRDRAGAEPFWLAETFPDRSA